MVLYILCVHGQYTCVHVIIYTCVHVIDSDCGA